MRRTITVYLRPADRALIVAAATARGVGPTTYLRLAALELARRELAAPRARDRDSHDGSR